MVYLVMHKNGWVRTTLTSDLAQPLSATVRPTHISNTYVNTTMGTGFASPRYHGFACSWSLGFPPALSTVILSINRTGRHTFCDLLNNSVATVYRKECEAGHIPEDKQLSIENRGQLKCISIYNSNTYIRST